MWCGVECGGLQQDVVLFHISSVCNKKTTDDNQDNDNSSGGGGEGGGGVGGGGGNEEHRDLTIKNKSDNGKKQLQ